MIRSNRAQDKHKKAFGSSLSPNQIVEIMKCSTDPKYFIEQHLAVMNHVHLPIVFLLRPEQQDYIDTIDAHHSTVCKHPRQAGISSATIAYLLWQSQFQFDKTILIVLPSYQHATFAKDQFKMMYSNIPEYISSGITCERRDRIEFENGTRISFVAATESSGRGMTISTLYIGDLAYIDPIRAHAMWHSLAPCIGTGTKLIIHSTPTDKFNLFYDIWDGAVTGQAPIHAHKISFWDLYDASQSRWDSLASQLGEKIMRRSYGCEFIS